MKPTTARDLGWIDVAPVVLRASRRIDAPTPVVWERIADHASWPQWWDALSSVEPGEPAEGVGGSRRVRLSGGVTIDEEFLAWDEGHRFAFAVTHMKPRLLRSLVEDVRLEADGDATIVTYVQAWEPKGGAPVQALLRRAVGPQIGTALAELARLVDG